MSDTNTAVPALKHYAIWYGPSWDQIYDCPIVERDPAKFEMDKDADFFRFYDRLELDWEVDGAVIKLRSEEFNYSPYYVPGGHLLTGDKRDAAFSVAWQSIAHQRNEYAMFSTRHRHMVPLYRAEVVFLPPVSS